MKGVNKVFLIGTLGREPEITYTQHGTAITRLSVATNSSWKDRHGEKQEHTEWHRVVVFGKLAEISAEYLKTGTTVHLYGSLRTQKWQNDAGEDRYTTEIVASEMQILRDSKKSELKTAKSDQDNISPLSYNDDDDIPF